MKYLMLALLISVPAHAKLACEKGEGYSVVDIRTETGCPSGLVLENVETMCIAQASPAIDTLHAGRKYEICSVTVLDSTKKSWEARVMSSVEVRMGNTAREELNSAVSNLNGRTIGEIQGIVTVPVMRKNPVKNSDSAFSVAPNAASAAAH